VSTLRRELRRRIDASRSGAVRTPRPPDSSACDCVITFDFFDDCERLVGRVRRCEVLGRPRHERGDVIRVNSRVHKNIRSEYGG
jgi:hypothetical protein